MNKHELPEGWTLTTPDNYIPVPLINRDKWIEALESGRYKQGPALLRTADDKCCCLGVLLSLDPNMPTCLERGRYYFDDEPSGLPQSALQFKTLDSAGVLPGGCYITKGDIAVQSLAEANDSTASFATIAAALRILYANQD